MLNITAAKLHIIGQGAEHRATVDIIRNLQAAGHLPADDLAPLTTREITSLIIGATAFESTMATDHLVRFAAMPDNTGTTFGEAVKALLEAEPANLNVTSIRVSQKPAAAWIIGADGEEIEFIAEDFSGYGFRNEVVISGGLLGALTMKLHTDTESGWTGRQLTAEED